MWDRGSRTGPLSDHSMAWPGDVLLEGLSNSKGVQRQEGEGLPVQVPTRNWSQSKAGWDGLVTSVPCGAEVGET